MARFFFDIHDGRLNPIDMQGIELQDARVAKREAILTLTQTMFFDDDQNDQRGAACHVRDQAGQVIYRAEINLQGGWVSAHAPVQ